MRQPESVAATGLTPQQYQNFWQTHSLDRELQDVPGITAVAQPTFEMGRRAALLLLRRLEDPTCGRTIEVLEPSLVVRGSTGPPAT